MTPFFSWHKDWAVRHCALLGLTRVYTTCAHLPMKDGMSNSAWGAVVERQRKETDERVLEAYKISKVGNLKV